MALVADDYHGGGGDANGDKQSVTALLFSRLDVQNCRGFMYQLSELVGTNFLIFEIRLWGT